MSLLLSKWPRAAFWAGWMAVLAMGLSAAIAWSEEPPLSAEEAKVRDTAFELFKQGRNAFKAGDYDQARELFQKAWAAYDKEPRIALALAKSYDKAGALEKAKLYYEHFLRLAPATAEYQQDRDQTGKRVAELRDALQRRPATLKFKGLPSGAQLIVDGKATDVDASGALQVEAGQHSVRVTMDKRVPFERPVVSIGPGETKEIEVVLVAPIDPSVLPRDHTWTLVAGGTTAAGVVATSVLGFLLWRAHDQYNARFDELGKPRDATRADYPINGQPCRIGVLQAGTGTLECAAAVDEANERMATIKGYQIGTAVAGGLTLLTGVATAVAYVTAPPAETSGKKQATRAQWQVQPWSSATSHGAMVSLRF